ncbi:MAG: cytochrome c1 [Betaproteobacteria bacterium]|nr:cytochrome c1 [Betaproteobacteria bacterium]
MKNLLALLFCLPAFAMASEEAKLDRAPIDTRDVASIQHGAKIFVNYCLNCHGAAHMRYNRLKDLSLSEAQIKDNLMFISDKVGDTMRVAAPMADQKTWFGKAPPDLSVIARARGADWLYTYLRGYYRDPGTATGWNNIAFPSVGMPHVLWQLQGQQVMKVEEREGLHGKEHIKKLVLETTGSLKPAEYDRFTADLVNYLVFMGEPAQTTRKQIGYVVLMVLGVLFVLAYLLKKEYWKDVH